ncbi:MULTISPECIES: type II secretion system protein M [Photobacterium]|uniref:Type II secretion system protein M n=1 Tax=Photobacterium ganghwense TaxID=320778 RepID=A0A0J1H2Q0_9GAMM|nr:MULTISPECIES: type II secretion system protein M [Photobacterium]KLV06124.1 general secretion pathway protein GspM [Photobacterium ganghwense]PSU04943.1 type II secretion system protein M [Photobacterium ganghwense]
MKAWWNGLSLREQRLVLGGGIALFIAILYWGIWQPMANSAANAETHLQRERQLLSWVSQKADEIVALRGTSGSTGSVSDKGLNQVINETTRRFQIEVIRMQPRSEAVQVWVKPVPFNTLVNWLAFLRDEHGIDTQFLDVTKTDRTGMVEVNRLQLGRG